MSSLPVIDISPLFTNNKDDLQRVALAVDEACRTSGFFYITGHQIPKDRYTKLTAMAQKFFDLPLEEKLKIDIRKSAHHRGYGTYEAEQLDVATRDWKETFDMGCHMSDDHPEVRAGRPLRGPNRHPDLQGWAELMEQHYADMQQLALVLLRALAIALELDDDFFDAKFLEPQSAFRMIHYPGLPEEKGRVVCGSHSDYGIITLLYQDAVGGLQVKSLDGRWIDAAPIENSFVVNIGDMMEMWSNNRYKSTLHRVLNHGVGRISMPFFTEPNPETIITCLPNCFDKENPAKYPPVKAVDWLQSRFKQTYAHRSDKGEELK